MLFILSACGSTATLETTDDFSESMGITDFSGRTLHFEEPPERIAALGNGELDLIYALGGEAVGRPSSDNIPVEKAEGLEPVGTTHELDLERLTLAAPDLVIGNSPMNEKDIATVEGIGAEMLLTSANAVEEIQEQITLLGQVLNAEAEAESLQQEIETTVTQLGDNPLASPPRVLLVYGAPGSVMVALPNSLAGDILELSGGENIAADFEQLDAFPQYATLHPERIIQAEPDLILFMGHGHAEAAKDSFLLEMEHHSTWASLEAVQQERFEVLPEDLFGTNPGSRITEALQHMRDELEAVKS
ncbi:hypothetical protein JCM19039_3870 [Geomicrobium sp. JCM 19039]|nr:hypothetical protein JCM19039_3870 [Geomicrobium sp. JCM 19039]